MLAGNRVVMPLRRLAVTPATRHISTSCVAKAPTSDSNSNEDSVPEPTILRAEPISALPPSGENPAPRTSGEKVLGYKGWLIQNGDKYKEMKPGKTNYIGGNTTAPFPLNPWFRVRAPLADVVKEQIYKDYLANPTKVTPRILGDKYKVSIKRIEAILKLKAIEHHMIKHDGFTAQRKLTTGMESMLAVRGTENRITEKTFVETPRVSSPRFHAVPEGEPFTSADAAEVMGRKPYQHIVDRLTASKPFTIDYEGLDPEFAPPVGKKISKFAAKRLEELGPAEDEILDKDPKVASTRWKFIFIDTAKQQDMKDRAVYIREQDGTLKKAGREFKLKRYGKIWKR
ncbi:hypothetical protein IW140_001229 [Coemansia sp. RSA 1813]|nr:hypothetical protein EV178_001181 [Coemansia sp. RSA 1646]KAJ1772163.1 hypothetical protein LPJ74_001748 [Coemansia sp. RSA 1843]KAJ2091719.1 hypothetical protein IW138_001702 [Coemansia sp. RSA 986]KAJ2216878.1 hypothetical protein EV179_000912 [Coemansia sp. RSA 487]KAJ2571880.1 hypothetical protein IW140_001229 [Coemansia sp. RSA 1813]